MIIYGKIMIVLSNDSFIISKEKFNEALVDNKILRENRNYSSNNLIKIIL